MVEGLILACSKCTTNRLAAGLHPNPLGELIVLPSPDPLAGLRGWAPIEGNGNGRWERRGRMAGRT